MICDASGCPLKKSFYKILGVDQRADPEKIKKAYRRAAKRCHPDISPKGEEKFKAVQEAYETLSDPEKRAVYDRDTLEKPVHVTNVYSSPYSVPIRPRFDTFDEIDEFFSPFERHWSREIYDFFDAGKRRDDTFYAEIFLSPEEAKKGGRVSFKIPLLTDCTRCHGTGNVRGLICGLCRGRGEEKSERMITVTIPPGVKDGMKIRIPLNDPDLRRIELVATVRISF